jgi:hypothetical protein
VKKIILTILLISIGAHLAVGFVAGVVVVARYFFPPPAVFTAAKDIRLPAKKREHKMNMAALDAMAPKPTFSDRMQSTRPTAFALPDLPSLPMDQMMPLDPSQIVSEQISSLSTSEAMGAGSGAAASGSGGFGKGMSFLGVQSDGQRILLMFDISTSVKTKAEKGRRSSSENQTRDDRPHQKAPDHCPLRNCAICPQLQALQPRTCSRHPIQPRCRNGLGRE